MFVDIFFVNLRPGSRRMDVFDVKLGKYTMSYRRDAKPGFVYRQALSALRLADRYSGDPLLGICAAQLLALSASQDMMQTAMAALHHRSISQGWLLRGVRRNTGHFEYLQACRRAYSPPVSDGYYQEYVSPKDRGQGE